MANELEIRAQAAYGSIGMRLTRTVDEVANMAGEIAVLNARLEILNAASEADKARIAELEAKVKELSPAEGPFAQ